jgi:hypothetical protein
MLPLRTINIGLVLALIVTLQIIYFQSRQLDRLSHRQSTSSTTSNPPPPPPPPALAARPSTSTSGSITIVEELLSIIGDASATPTDRLGIDTNTNTNTNVDHLPPPPGSPLSKPRSFYDKLQCSSSSTNTSQPTLLIIVPIRAREYQQRLFVDHIYRFFCAYRLLPNGERFYSRHTFDWRVIFVEQLATDGKLFNRGRLTNAAFNIMHNDHLASQCSASRPASRNATLPLYSPIIVHDVDMLPLPPNSPNVYYDQHNVKHLATHVDEHNNTLLYGSYVGGVLAFPYQHWVAVNGFANNYWGWGSEDDDLYLRIYHKRLPFTRPDPLTLGNYNTIKANHHQDSKAASRQPNRQTYGAFAQLDAAGKDREMQANGFSSTPLVLKSCKQLTDRVFHAVVDIS